MAAPAAAQVPGIPSVPAATDVRLGSAARQERLGLHHIRYTGAVEIELVSQGIRFSADVADYYDDQHRLVAVGNVVFVTQSSRISADRAEFDTKARTGTFFNAFGSASVSDKVDRSFFGGQEPDAFFYGETIEKLGVDRYRIRKGGFTTCVQPTPRWEVTANTVTLVVDKRAILKNAVLKVKDVPLFYLPAMYFPINKEDRSTGFLMPVYGTSTIRGSSLSNAFFWAINRSQDLTLMHDWFTKTGQGYGGEYRYVASAGSNGEFRMYRINERAVTFQQSGQDITQPARQSFEIRTNVVQALPGGFRARGTVDYFSDVTVQQQYQLDLYNASLRTRNYQGNVSGSLGKGNSISATYGVNEIFYGDNDSQTIGGRPRIQFNRALTKLGPLPLYFTANGEYANIVRFDTADDVKINDQGLTRINVSPSLQFPLTKLAVLLGAVVDLLEQHLLDREPGCETAPDQRVDLPAVLRHADERYRADPDAGLEHARHRLRRALQARRRAGVRHPADHDLRRLRPHRQDRRRRLHLRRDDARHLRRHQPLPGPPPGRRRRARRRPGSASSSTSRCSSPTTRTRAPAPSTAVTPADSYGAPPSNFSPIALTVRANPTNAVGASLRLEYNQEAGEFETIQANGTVKAGAWLETTGGWSQRKYLQIVNPLYRPPNNFLSSRTNVNFGRSHVGGAYHFDFNLSEKTLVQQRIGLFYNAQCCGVGVEYQAYNYPNISRFIVPQDKRFNISFTLAGVGSFSNILGAFGIGQGATGTAGGRRF